MAKAGTGSASKVDILRSALEINHKSSNNSVMSKTDNRQISNQSLTRNRADSAPKLNHSTMKNISQPALEAVVLEVSRSKCSVENNFRDKLIIDK